MASEATRSSGPGDNTEATPVLDLDGRPQPVSDALLDESAVRVGADGLG
ncbi:hypothetical protein ABZ725_49605 [Streptomyces sp. NPDC006872]